MPPAIAFVSMPGLGAVAAGFFVTGGGLLLALIAIAVALVSIRRARARSLAAGLAVAGLLLAAGGALLIVLGDGPDGETADVLAIGLVPLVLAIALGGGWIVRRAVGRRQILASSPESLS